MPPSVCFDALGTCFTLADIIQKVDEEYGDELKEAGYGSKGFVNDWFHSAQRDYTYLSLISPPPPPIASILKTLFPFSLSTALSISLTSLNSSKIQSITSLLSSLPAASKLHEAFSHLSENKGKIIIVTNGSKETTEGYTKLANVGEMVENVLSCDEVGKAKPHKEVYEAALDLCVKLEHEIQVQNEKEEVGERWFVAAHLWDLAAARKAGFKTGFVAYDLPSTTGDLEQDLQSVYEIYGKPDIVGSDLLEVVKQIV